MERQAKGFMHVLAAFAVVEQVCLEIIEDREEDTARLVGRDIAIGARNALRDGGCQ